ncbi:metallophosphoesterase family protein [Terriglobus aquaticus]|uniref:Metallophosphoesterase family protein n=1 Tax=Terriglobus aquaticus TaxID=940139 RepID=A0ABW9KJG5_9BACT|nr:metallophosphoesterase [Terriglobus aquaticus]
MTQTTDSPFQPLPLNKTSTVSWIHIGDLHMVKEGEQNEIDLGRIVDTINRLFSDGSVNFVYLPGDIADDGSAPAYRAVRKHLDRLKIPWFGIVGDHDVHEKSFENFTSFISASLYGGFILGGYRFLRLNAFGEPRPDSFTLSEEQLAWMEAELAAAEQLKQRVVLFLHCYPSDLLQGGDALRKMLQKYPVLLIDMGHTHYNEISNDGTVLYSATRSTGQVEEGAVGFSLTTIDDDVISWHFVKPDDAGLVAITSPSDHRLLTARTAAAPKKSSIEVAAKIWAEGGPTAVSAVFSGEELPLRLSEDGLWRAVIDGHRLADGLHQLTVSAVMESGSALSSSIQLAIGDLPLREVKHIDHENSIGEWSERGLLDTQLGPNKNGRKW